VNARELLEDYAADGIDGYGLREHAAPEAFAALRAVMDTLDFRSGQSAQVDDLIEEVFTEIENSLSGESQ
jgi:hypothetical protein